MSIWSDAARDAYRKTHRFPGQPGGNKGFPPLVKKESPLDRKIAEAEKGLTKPKLGRPQGDSKLFDKDLFAFARPTSGPKLG